MTDRLDPQSRANLINYKLEKARLTLSEADLLAKANFYNTAVNRLYYAAYYTASALMLKHSLEAVTHKGIKTMLGMEFIRPRKLETEYGRIYQRLFDSRQAGDYDEFVIYDEDIYSELRPQAEKFVNALSNYIQTLD